MITGAAGEYFTAAELSQLGWIAALTWRNAPRTDLLAQRPDGSRTAAIQVKARNSGSFQLGTLPRPSSEGGNEWFVLVSLDDAGMRPTFYVVPRDHVAALAHCTYEIYLAARSGRRTSRAFSPSTALSGAFLQ